jgi:lipoate-protein ligase A
MALDELILERIDSGEEEFDLVLRTFEWEPACVSLGRLQDPDREIDRRRLLGDGVDLVVRPTGGRAVWHHDEVTYSLIARRDHPLVKGSLSESLESVSRALVAALRSLDLQAESRRAEAHLAGKRRDVSHPCFTSHGVSEVMVDGRKVVGSAQTRTRSGFLEHGSLIITNQQPLLTLYMPDSAPTEWRERVRKSLEEGVRGIRELRPGVTRDELHSSLASAFEEILDQPFVTVGYRSFDGPELERLVEKKQALSEAGADV